MFPALSVLVHLSDGLVTDGAFGMVGLETSKTIERKKENVSDVTTWQTSLGISSSARYISLVSFKFLTRIFSLAHEY